MRVSKKRHSCRKTATSAKAKSINDGDKNPNFIQNSENLLQKLRKVLETIMELKANVDLIHKDFYPSLRKDYDALQDLIIMQENITSLVNSRNKIEEKVREKYSENNDEAIFKLLINGEEDERMEGDDFEQINEEDEISEQNQALGETKPNVNLDAAQTPILIEEKIKPEPDEEDAISDPDWNVSEEEASFVKEEKELKNFIQKKKPRLPKKRLKKEAKVALKDPPKKRTKAPRKPLNILRASEPLLPCSICQKLIRQYRLKLHEIGHSLKPVNCPICHKKYRNEKILATHSLIHGEKKFICEVCGSGFHRPCYLSVHMKVHQQERPLSCTQCEATFKHKQSLKTHIEAKHSENGVMCSKCGLTFATKTTLSNHISMIHEDAPRSHICDICGTGFKKKTHLQYHVKTHSNPNSRKRGLNKERGETTRAGNPRVPRTKWNQKEDGEKEGV